MGVDQRRAEGGGAIPPIALSWLLATLATIIGLIKVASWRVEQLALLASELVKHDQPSPRSHF